jgi:hypothetical protein
MRTHFTFRVDTWTPDGESIVEHIAGVEDYQVALATYRAANELASTQISLEASIDLAVPSGAGMIIIGTDISAVMDRIVGQWRLQCCRMAITIYQKQMKLFLPTWQHRRLTNASTIASIIRWQMSLILGVIHNGTANPRLDASLLR